MLLLFVGTTAKRETQNFSFNICDRLRTSTTEIFLVDYFDASHVQATSKTSVNRNSSRWKPIARFNVHSNSALTFTHIQLASKDGQRLWFSITYRSFLRHVWISFWLKMLPEYFIYVSVVAIAVAVCVFTSTTHQHFLRCLSHLYRASELDRPTQPTITVHFFVVFVQCLVLHMREHRIDQTASTSTVAHSDCGARRAHPNQSICCVWSHLFLPDQYVFFLFLLLIKIPVNHDFVCVEKLDIHCCYCIMHGMYHSTTGIHSNK